MSSCALRLPDGYLSVVAARPLYAVARCAFQMVICLWWRRGRDEQLSAAFVRQLSVCGGGEAAMSS